MPCGRGESDFTEKKSRFIGEARKVEDASEARSVVASLREVHPRSRHVVWAYIIGADGSLKGMSDDGEPHGTAGRPVLDHIAGLSLTNTLVTVVRYFGGIKLGTGGLCSAYSKSAQQALASMKREKLIPRREVRLEIEYSMYNSILQLLDTFNGRVISDNFGEKIVLGTQLPLADLEDFLAAADNACRGAAAMEVI